MTLKCRHGHSYTPENTLRSVTGARVCRECKRIRDKRTRQFGGEVPTLAEANRGHLALIRAYFAKHHRRAA